MKTILHAIILITSIAITSVKGFGQCYPDRHSTTWFDGWISCDMAASPNNLRGESHWILYDFGSPHMLYNTHFWNLNDPSHLDWGIAEIAIDYSDTGAEWKTFGNTTIAKGTGKSIYEGQAGPDLQGIVARYLLITVIANQGGSCAGFSEIRIEAEASASTSQLTTLANWNDPSSPLRAQVFPNPFTTASTLTIQSTDDRMIHYQIVDVLGREVFQGQIPGGAEQTVSLTGVNWQAGLYQILISQGDYRTRLPLLKIE
ncbi:MAG: T9SS type A sorting domain-containing protein [Saprospiraceae bacterium]|nr:T9SS type A sorting domain-containing protein [Saprospiraceae bacterium]MCB9317816.1 T9SS type A sorting domain-containing protein [Lewinellaceae bacterium]